MRTTDAATNRWTEILAHFDVPATILDGKHHACPCTGEGDDRFRFANRNGSGNYFCSCSGGEKGGMGLLMCKTGLPFADIARKVDQIIGNKPEAESKERVSYYSHVLRSRAEKSKRSAYLASRGLEVAPGLEWCRDVDYRHEDGTVTQHPAMLAPVTRDGEFLTYHVTYLGKSGKADVPIPRKILPPSKPTAGGACELYPAADTMGIAEGVETAIAAKMLHGFPVWAALNTALMKAWQPPAICRHLIIYADNDAHYAGHAAAYHLAHKLRDKLESITVFFPTKIGTDWNDQLLAGRDAAA